MNDLEISAQDVLRSDIRNSFIFLSNWDIQLNSQIVGLVGYLEFG